MTSMAHALLRAGLVEKDEVELADKRQKKQLRKQELGKHAQDKDEEEALYGRRPVTIVSGTDDIN